MKRKCDSPFTTPPPHTVLPPRPSKWNSGETDSRSSWEVRYTAPMREKASSMEIENNVKNRPRTTRKARGRLALRTPRVLIGGPCRWRRRWQRRRILSVTRGGRGRGGSLITSPGGKILQNGEQRILPHLSQQIPNDLFSKQRPRGRSRKQHMFHRSKSRDHQMRHKGPTALLVHKGYGITSEENILTAVYEAISPTWNRKKQ